MALSPFFFWHEHLCKFPRTSNPGSLKSYQSSDLQTPVASGSSDKASSQILSLNLHFVIYRGQVPEADEDD
jgi:hypothetical protein